MTYKSKRMFGLVFDDQNNSLQMTSCIDGSYGEILIVSQFDLIGLTAKQEVLNDCGEPLENLFEFRQSELSFFVSAIVPLFKTLNYGLSSSQK